MDDLVKIARRAKGSDLLPKVSFGVMNAEVLILRMADRIEALEAEAEAANAIIAQKRDEVLALRSEVARLREALTPSGDTKAAYMSEIECDCPTENWRHYVPWTSIKEIMKMICDRAAMENQSDE